MPPHAPLPKFTHQSLGLVTMFPCTAKGLWCDLGLLDEVNSVDSPGGLKVILSADEREAVETETEKVRWAQKQSVKETWWHQAVAFEIEGGAMGQRMQGPLAAGRGQDRGSLRASKRSQPCWPLISGQKDCSSSFDFRIVRINLCCVRPLNL